MSDAAGDVQTAEEASRKLLGPEPLEPLESDKRDRLVDQGSTTSAIAHVQGTEAVDVFTHRELLVHGHLLGHHTDATLEPIGRRRHALAEDGDAAVVIAKQL